MDLIKMANQYTNETKQEYRERRKKDFWDKVNITDLSDCWEWEGGKFNHGYGRFHLKYFGDVTAHRAYYILFVGLDEELEVCHMCDNKKCVNPHHLWLGTHGENMKDASEKGRIKGPDEANVIGEDVGKAKLTEEEVKQLRKDHKQGVELKDLGKKYGINWSYASKVANGDYWSHVNDS
jgi:hypothetical protein